MLCRGRRLRAVRDADRVRGRVRAGGHGRRATAFSPGAGPNDGAIDRRRIRSGRRTRCRWRVVDVLGRGDRAHDRHTGRRGDDERKPRGSDHAARRLRGADGGQRGTGGARTLAHQRCCAPGIGALRRAVSVEQASGARGEHNRLAGDRWCSRRGNAPVPGCRAHIDALSQRIVSVAPGAARIRPSRRRDVHERGHVSRAHRRAERPDNDAVVADNPLRLSRPCCREPGRHVRCHRDR